MNRRILVALVASVALWPAVAPAQAPPLPVIGFVRNTSAASAADLVAAFRRGLADQDFVEGRNVAVEYRWTDSKDDRLGSLIADLVGRKVAVLVSGGGSITALAVKAAAGNIPVVFELGADPVKVGLVP